MSICSRSTYAGSDGEQGPAAPLPCLEAAPHFEIPARNQVGTRVRNASVNGRETLKVLASSRRSCVWLYSPILVHDHPVSLGSPEHRSRWIVELSDHHWPGCQLVPTRFGDCHHAVIQSDLTHLEWIGERQQARQFPFPWGVSGCRSEEASTGNLHVHRSGGRKTRAEFCRDTRAGGVR